MDAEIIVIEDSPPSSPVPVNNIETLDLTDEHLPTFLEKTTLWTKKTSNFIKKTMNLSMVENNNNETDNSSNCINLSTENCNKNRNSVINTNVRNTCQKKDDYVQPSAQINGGKVPVNCNLQQYYPRDYMYGFKPSDTEIGTVCFPVYNGRTCLAPIPFPQPVMNNNSGFLIKNFLPTPVKMNENLQYFQPNFDQRPFYDTHEEYAQYMPEFIDINNFIDYDNFDINSVINTSLTETEIDSNKTQKTTESGTKSTWLKNNKRYNKNSVPLFLKRNRNTNSLNKMKVIDLSSDNSSPTEEANESVTSNPEHGSDTKDEDLDVVYVGAYAREPKNPGNRTTYKLPDADTNAEEVKETSRSSSDSVSPTDESNNSLNPQESSTEDKPTKGKRKRKHILTVPRRNPKRQVQIEKDYLKLLDNVICESKKEAKIRKPKRTNKGKSADDSKKPRSNTCSQNNKRSPRQSANCGAIYRPPSPFTKNHFRQWPVSGMHERPEYNPVTGKLEQFDYITRNISAVYQQQQSKKDSEAKNQTQKTTEKTNAENKELSLLCHEMFHHVFAYGATVKSLMKTEANTQTEVEKLEFMKDLSLMEPLVTPLNLCIERKPKPVLNETESIETKKIISDLKDLMQNSLLLYCLTNDIDRNQVAKYIQSLDPDEIIQWSNKQFNLID